MSEAALAQRDGNGRQPLLRLLSDARLAKLAAGGSTPAFAAIYQRHHQQVYRYCRSIVGNEHDARDALQNTMEKALAGLEGESREIAVGPWLFRIAHNESISLLRRRHPDVALDEAAELSAPEVDLDTRQRLRSLIEDLDLLTERQRSALVMRELSGLEFGEIALALETSPEGAKQSVYEARLALREHERGREMSCDEICGRISAQDRRRLQARAVRAHLKSCDDCRAFAEQVGSRPGQLAAIAPPLGAPIALGILNGILGAGGGGTAALAGAGAAAGLGSGAAIKIAVAALVAIGAGGVAIEAGRSDATLDPRPPVESAIAAPPQENRQAPGMHGAAESETEARDGGSRSSQGAGGDKGSAGPGTGVDEQSAAPGTEPASDDASDDSSGGPENGSGGPTGTPPGLGGTPSGHGGTPPGLGTAPPGGGSSGGARTPQEPSSGPWPLGVSGSLRSGVS